jgi:hypothetical protein
MVALSFSSGHDSCPIEVHYNLSGFTYYPQVHADPDYDEALGRMLQ